MQPKFNKANQHQSLRFLDSRGVAFFVHGFAIFAQKNQQQVKKSTTSLPLFAELMSAWGRFAT